MNIYVIRHGQTDLNIQGRLQGRCGLPLNRIGVRQAKETAAELGGVAFDCVFSSPQQRAVQTAEIITNSQNIIEDSRLDVFDVGEADGEVIAELGDMKFGLIPDKSKFRGVEDESVFLARVNSFMDELISTRGNEHINVLIAGHKCTTGAVDCYFNGLPSDGNFFSRSSKNGKFKTYNT